MGQVWGRRSLWDFRSRYVTQGFSRDRKGQGGASSSGVGGKQDGWRGTESTQHSGQQHLTKQQALGSTPCCPEPPWPAPNHTRATASPQGPPRPCGPARTDYTATHWWTPGRQGPVCKDLHGTARQGPISKDLHRAVHMGGRPAGLSPVCKDVHGTIPLGPRL